MVVMVDPQGTHERRCHTKERQMLDTKYVAFGPRISLLEFLSIC